MTTLLIRGGRLVEPQGLRPADVLVGADNRISKIGTSLKSSPNTKVIDATDALVFPLLIDGHVHFREPGMEHKATMMSEAASALAGGVGCTCDMPNTIPPTVTISALEDKVRRSTRIDGCRMKFFFGVTEAGHLQALEELWTGASMELKRLKHHCSGVKLYLDHSTGNQKIESSILEDVFRTCAKLAIPIIAHCEDPSINKAAQNKWDVESGDVSLHSKMRPPEAEGQSINDAIEIVKKTGAAFHVAHLSTRIGLDAVRAAKKNGLPVTCEVAPHHLFLTTDDYPSLGALAKMNPPLRSTEDQTALWAGILDGTVDCIATDHAPHTLEEKSVKNPLLAPSGVPCVETMLPLLLTVAAGSWPHPSGKKNAASDKFSSLDILRLCFSNPNRIFSLNQPHVATESPARLAIVDPKTEWTIRAKDLHSACTWTPYEGWNVCGKVVQTLAH